MGLDSLFSARGSQRHGASPSPSPEPGRASPSQDAPRQLVDASLAGASLAVVRKAFEAKSGSQLTVRKGQKVTVIELNGSWAWCEAENAAGWMPKAYLLPDVGGGGGDSSAAVVPAGGGHVASTGSAQQAQQVQLQLRRAAEPQGANDDAATRSIDDAVPGLPNDWLQKLEGTMILHTVQNAMRLAAYLLQLLTGGYGTVSALHIACWEGSADAVTAVTNGKTKVVADWHERPGDLTPLHIAAMCGHVGVVKCLLDMDVDANVPTVHGLRALHISASSSPELSEALVDGKADVAAATSDQDTALHFACCYQQVPNIEMLLQAGANSSAPNAFGVTPLHIAISYAALEGQEAAEVQPVLLLLSAAADPQARDRHGRSSVDICKMAGGHLSLLELLTGGPKLPDQDDSKAGVAARVQQLAEKRLSDLYEAGEQDEGEQDDDVTSEGGELMSLAVSRRGQAQDNTSLKSRRQAARDPATEESMVRLTAENSQLAADVARLARELNESQSNGKLLQELLDNSKQHQQARMQSTQQSFAAGQLESNEAVELLKRDLEQERDVFQQRHQALEAEREKWQQERQELLDAVAAAAAARDGARSEVEVAKAAVDAAAAKVSAVSQDQAAAAAQAAQAAQEALRAAELEQRQHELEDMLGQKDVEVEERLRSKEAKVDELMALKDAELAQLGEQLASARQEGEQRSVELQALGAARTQELERLGAEVQAAKDQERRLSEDLRKQMQEKAEVWNQLSELQKQHSELREELMRARQEHQGFVSAATEKEKDAESSAREQEIIKAKLEEDLAAVSANLSVMTDYKERAEYAEKMLRPFEIRAEELQTAFAQEQQLRKRYHNQMQDLKGAIRVFARIRPTVSRETGQPIAVQKKDAFSLEVENKGARTFNFDAIYDENNSQEDVFKDCQSLIHSAFDGADRGDLASR